MNNFEILLAYYAVITLCLIILWELMSEKLNQHKEKEMSR